MIRAYLFSAALVCATFAGVSPGAAQTGAQARKIHNELLTLDTHLDTPALFSRPGWDITQKHDVAKDGSQIDLPRMIAGGLDGGFFVVYTPQGPRTPGGHSAARDAALIRAMEIREMIAEHGDKFELALTADDAEAIAARKKRIAFMSIENSYPLGADLTLMQTFYKLGVRLIGPAHFRNNELADSSTDIPQWKGLSPLGEQFVAEANRLGMMLDASHSSDAVLDQMITLSKTPVILSHSGVKAVFDHPRNIDDTRLKALAASGGVIQMAAFNSYLIPVPPNPQRDAEMGALNARLFSQAPLSDADRAALLAQRRAIDEKYATPRATFEDFMAQLLHALKVGGVDHVGIGLDFDGGGGVTGLEDASDYWKITERLLKEGYSKDDLAKIWGGNVLRVLRQVEAYKAQAAK